ESTTRSFRRNAGNHKVIHIATHAAFNNMQPEKSGLIFAKGASGSDSNWLYLNDIYACDLSSELTLLTACETGRPGYKDGEGLVSLAHAFNYAGSRNILTAIWKVDEQASCQLTASFLKYIQQGLPTDEALRQAKLDYLAGAEGRLADPGYWSGLVLMGTPVTISFTSDLEDHLALAGAGVLLAGMLLTLGFRRRTLK